MLAQRETARETEMNAYAPDEGAEGLGGLGGVDGDPAEGHEEVDVHVHAVHVRVELGHGAAAHAGVHLNEAGAVLHSVWVRVRT